ncbi:hypothetical protein TB1_006485 [Malus domestica]
MYVTLTVHSHRCCHDRHRHLLNSRTIPSLPPSHYHHLHHYHPQPSHCYKSSSTMGNSLVDWLLNRARKPEQLGPACAGNEARAGARGRPGRSC